MCPRQGSATTVLFRLQQCHSLWPQQAPRQRYVHCIFTCRILFSCNFCGFCNNCCHYYFSTEQKKIVSCHSYQYYSISCQHCLSHPGAPEIDILEAMPGFENLHKNNPNTYTHLPYYSASLQVSPGMLDCRFLECLHYGIAVCEVNNA